MGIDGGSIIRVNSLDDSRVAAYRNLKDRELARLDGRFIAEGEHLVRRLIASDYPVDSVLLAERHVEKIAPLVAGGTPIFATSAEIVNQIIGYGFHSGIIACGRRKPGATIEEIATNWKENVTVVLCQGISNTENMGALIRVASAFGADALVLGENCCDPFFRQSVRVSMGTIFKIPLIQSEDLLCDMRELADKWNVELAAAVLAEDAEPLASAKRGERIGVLFGNEAQGLDAKHIAACRRRITIPMKLGTDSLNIAVAAGVVLYHFTRGFGGLEQE